MKLLFFIIVATVRVCLFVLQIAMLLRAVLSWFSPGEDNALKTFLYSITEPFILPVRNILSRFHIAEGLPIDIAFFVTFLILSLLRAIL